MMTKNICFYSPSHVLGGNQTLFARCALLCATAFPDTRILVADYNNNCMKSYMDTYKIIPPNIEFINVSEHDPVAFPDDTLIVLSSDRIRFAHNRFLTGTFTNKKNRVLFWILDGSAYMGLFRYGYPVLKIFGYDTARRVMPLLFLLSPMIGVRLKNALEFLMEHNSLIAMAPFSIKGVSSLFRCKSRPPYVPLIVDSHFLKDKKIVRSKVQKIAWLGRFSDCKTWALNNLIHQFDDYIGTEGKDIEFHIIGEGPDEALILEKIKKSGLKFIFHGKQTGRELEEKLIDVDMVFACGTSAIEAMKLGTPAVLVNVEFTEFYDPKVGYFCLSADNGEIGSYVKKGVSHMNIKLNTFKELFETYEQKSDYLSDQSFQIYKAIFSPEAVFDNLKYYIDHASATLEDLSNINIYELGFIEAIFPPKNQKSSFLTKRNATGT